jgi:hypothetical protein
MIRTSLVAAFAVVVAMSARPRVVHAQSASAQAELLFRQGRELMTAGKLAEACAAFDESEKLEPAPTTLLNLGACREKNGQLASAWGAYLDAERQTRTATDPANQQLHQISSDKAQKLEPRISKLTISVPADSQIDRLEILRGGDRVDPATWNRALPIDGGTYKIGAHAPGTAEWTTTVTIAPQGDSKTVDIPKLPTLPPNAGATTSSTTPSPTPSTDTTTGTSASAAIMPAHRSHTVPILVGAGAVALLGGALGCELWAESTYNDAKAETTSQSRRDSLESSANHERYVDEGLTIGGVAAAGVAVWLFVRHHDEPAPMTAGTRVVVSPTGIALVGGF